MDGLCSCPSENHPICACTRFSRESLFLGRYLWTVCTLSRKSFQFASCSPHDLLCMLGLCCQNCVSNFDNNICCATTVCFDKKQTVQEPITCCRRTERFSRHKRVFYNPRWDTSLQLPTIFYVLVHDWFFLSIWLRMPLVSSCTGNGWAVQAHARSTRISASNWPTACKSRTPQPLSSEKQS